MKNFSIFSLLIAMFAIVSCTTDSADTVTAKDGDILNNTESSRLTDRTV